MRGRRGAEATEEDTMKVGDHYTWKNQPERLIYLGVEVSNGPWHQFAKVESPIKVWCEVRAADLVNFEPTAKVKEQTP